MLEISLRNLLLNDTNVSARVAYRVYHLEMHQNTIYPAITFSRVGTNRGHTLNGPSGFAVASFSVECWAENGVDAIELKDDVITALDGWSGLTSEGDTVYEATIVSDGDSIEDIPTDELISMHMRAIQIEIQYLG